jgi:indole-3-glycerol phosphate synthase/phosphoribosylanthranilate isomerase
MTGAAIREALDPGAVGILLEIAEERIARIERSGAAQGCSLPENREAPVVPFLREPRIICEVKRSSPSAGEIARGLDPVAQALRYADAGVPSVSILTEEGRFSGSLEDLMRVKAARRDLALLRKDFLLTEEDIDVSFRAGADAVLLIAALLTPEALRRLYRHAGRLGLAALVEVHDEEDLNKVQPFAPPLLGMNSRNLKTFAVDPFGPLALISGVDWPAQVVFESGISHPEHIRLAGEAGFSGALVGEAVVRRPELLPQLVEAARGFAPGAPVDAPRGPASQAPAQARAPQPQAPAPKPEPKAFFWRRLAGRRETRTTGRPAATPAAAGQPHRPLVKICGITNREDAHIAAGLGADVLGFVFAESPRRADPELLEALAELDVLKVAVVVTTVTPGGPGAGGPGRRALPPGVAELLATGLLDAVQFHGDEGPAECAGLAFPYYKALRVRTAEELRDAALYACPRVLLDHYDPMLAGGTGHRIGAEILSSDALPRPLWLAGGLSPENVREAVTRYRPELIDASSRLESAPGRKDPEKLKDFFKEVHHATLR